MKEDNNEISLGGLKTFKELFQSPIIKKLTKFITKRDFKKFDDQGLVPCYTVNNKKGYKIREIERWIVDELTDKYDGIKIISRFNVVNVSWQSINFKAISVSHCSCDIFIPPFCYFEVTYLFGSS